MKSKGNWNTMLEKLAENAYFVYSEELEYLLAAMEFLKPLNRNENIKKMIGDPDMKRYQVLKEVFDGLGDEAFGSMLEGITEFFTEEFSFAAYENCLLQMPRNIFIATFLQLPQEEIDAVVFQKTSLMDFYSKYPNIFKSYLTCSVVFEKTDWLIKEFISFTRSLQCDKADKFLKEQQEMVLQWKEQLTKELTVKEPLEVSEGLMQKTFFRRGPYETFYFMPAAFMPIRCCRLFERNQVLFFNIIQTNEVDQKLPLMLKAMADPTRYSILKLLKKEKHLSGMDIAERMGLATSTISHHMTQLKSCGLVHEEPAKNTKYYSLNEVNLERCIRNLENAFLTK